MGRDIISTKPVTKMYILAFYCDREIHLWMNSAGDVICPNRVPWLRCPAIAYINSLSRKATKIRCALLR